jgi:AAT family amino acid transporter
MIRSLADTNNAPAFLIDKATHSFAGYSFFRTGKLLGVSLAFVLPEQTYIFLVSSGGFSLLFNLCGYLFWPIFRFRKSHGCPPYGHAAKRLPLYFLYSYHRTVIGYPHYALIPGAWFRTFCWPGIDCVLFSSLFYYQNMPGIKKY